VADWIEALHACHGKSVGRGLDHPFEQYRQLSLERVDRFDLGERRAQFIANLPTCDWRKPTDQGGGGETREVANHRRVATQAAQHRWDLVVTIRANGVEFDHGAHHSQKRSRTTAGASFTIDGNLRRRCAVTTLGTRPYHKGLIELGRGG